MFRWICILIAIVLVAIIFGFGSMASAVWGLVKIGLGVLLLAILLAAIFGPGSSAHEN